MVQVNIKYKHVLGEGVGLRMDVDRTNKKEQSW